MTEIYHVTPITPNARLEAIGPRNLMVSHYRPNQLALALFVGKSVAFDNGAFSYFTEMQRLQGAARRRRLTAVEAARLAWLEQPRDWTLFYAWVEKVLFAPGRWAVIPDVIAEGSQAQDALVAQWPFGHRGAPVWHTGEPINRLLRLLDEFPRVCIGSTDDHWRIWKPGLHGKVLDPAWRDRMDEVEREVMRRHADPICHMLRGTGVVHLYPWLFSADSSSLAQNGHRYAMPLFGGSEHEHDGSRDYADLLENRPFRKTCAIYQTSPSAAEGDQILLF